MNFFQAQDKARRNTSWLIFLFFMAIISLVILTNLLLIGTFAYMGTTENDSFMERAAEEGIEVVEGCTLVMLQTATF